MRDETREPASSPVAASSEVAFGAATTPPVDSLTEEEDGALESELFFFVACSFSHHQTSGAMRHKSDTPIIVPMSVPRMFIRPAPESE